MEGGPEDFSGKYNYLFILKIGNKSSEFDQDNNEIRTDASYIYEVFIFSTDFLRKY